MTDQTLQIDINYPPKFKARYGYGEPVAGHISKLFEDKVEVQKSFLSKIIELKDQLSSIPFDADEDALTARWNQLWFPALDGMSMYTMVANNKPNYYVEIGSDNSTKFAVKA
ncbi:MAG: class I SAM-dependent methyltransferase, partial [Planctomycetota bacterium]